MTPAEESRARLTTADTDAVASTVEGRAWLAAAVDAVAVDPAAVRTRFPAVGRMVGRAPTGLAVSGGPLHTPTVDDEARGVLLDALLAAGGAAEVEGLYRHGDSAERRGVLRWLGRRDALPAAVPALALAEDAIRTNDPRLLAAALGPATVARLDPASFRQAVLKCVFMGVPLAGVTGLAGRADGELARMLAGYAAERAAAGRDVPADVWPLIESAKP